jgi:hypothetical protein
MIGAIQSAEGSAITSLVIYGDNPASRALGTGQVARGRGR